MNRCALLPAAYLLDQIAGDPEWFPHPVRIMGLAITRGEAFLRKSDRSKAEELIAGTVLTAELVTVSYSLTQLIIRQTYRRSKLLGWLMEILLGWTCLAARNLRQEATAVTEALDSGNIVLARQRLARIVGRDTLQLDIHEISRAVIETVAESASDGIIAPLFYMTLGGVPLAMAYKAVNTLDSMIGHKDARYFYFGKAAARLDDVANYLPARITALGIVVASQLDREAHPYSAWRTWLRDGSKHKSPNAGQPEGAMSGALQVRLGGDNTYNGELIPGEPIGEEFPAPWREHARKATRMVSVVALLGLGAGMLLAAFAQAGRSKWRH
jgi:adenosylcobinamide-phosphate synthase